MKTLKTSLLLAGLLTVSTAFAQGAPMSREQKNAAEQSIEAQAKADKKACDSMNGNAKDVCQAEAKAKEKTAKADLDFRASGSERDRTKAAQVKAEGEYEVAKERCEDQQGDAQKSCKDQAKQTYQATRDQAACKARRSKAAATDDVTRAVRAACRTAQRAQDTRDGPAPTKGPARRRLRCPGRRRGAAAAVQAGTGV